MATKIEQHLVCGKFIEVEKVYPDQPKDKKEIVEFLKRVVDGPDGKLQYVR